MDSGIKEFVVYDTEYWCDEGSPERGWNGIYDKPPLVVQIGAFKVSNQRGFPITGDFLAYVNPCDENGRPVCITQHFTNLTQITPQILEEKGRPLSIVIDSFKAFSGQRDLYSYGYDMLNTIVPSCFIAGINCPFEASQAKDIRRIFQKAGVLDAALNANSSGTIAQYLGVDMSESHFAHDARNDAMSLINAIRVLNNKGCLDYNFF